MKDLKIKILSRIIEYTDIRDRYAKYNQKTMKVCVSEYTAAIKAYKDVLKWIEEEEKNDEESV